MTLALSTWQIAALPTGEIQIGNVTVPRFLAADIHGRIGDALAEAGTADRQTVRAHVDRLFASATVRKVRWMLAGTYARCPVVILDANHAWVRLADLTTAFLLRDGKYARGFAAQWRLDSVFGPVHELAPGFARVSLAWPKSLETAQ